MKKSMLGVRYHAHKHAFFSELDCLLQLRLCLWKNEMYGRASTCS